MSVFVSKKKYGNLGIDAPLGKNNNFSLLSNLLRNTPCGKKWEGRTLLFTPCYDCIEYVHEHFPDAEWDDHSKSYLNDYLKDVELRKQSKKGDLSSLQDDEDFQYKLEPFQHQRDVFLLSRSMKNFALLMEMGTGKTKILIDTAAYLYSKSEINRVLVIAPNGVHRNWTENEIPKHMPDWCNYQYDYYSSRHGKGRLSKIRKMFEGNKKLVILAMNVEGFTSSRAKEIAEDFLNSGDSLLILDESSAIKRPGTLRTKFIVSLGKGVAYKRIATGSPITNGIENLFSQFMFLSPNIIGLRSYTIFKLSYCNEVTIPGGPGKSERKYIKSYINVDKLIKKIDPYSFRILKDECSDLPAKIYKLFPVEMSPKQKKAYVELRDEFITDIDGDCVQEASPLVRLLRLQQIACGYYPSESNDDLKEFEGGNLRIKALSQITNEILECGEKAIIWARFKKDIYSIEELLGDTCVSYHGDVDEDDRVKASHRFQNDESISFMVAMLSSNSGAVRGHTWTAANTSIYYSNTFDLDARQQSEDRMHRIGLKNNKAVYIDLMVPGTIERKIINSLRNKKSISDLVTMDGPTGFLEFINE